MKNLKKVLALVLAFACAFTMFAGAVVYPDVPAGSEYSEAITMLSDLGIIQGKDDGKYHSEDTITRAEACALIARMLTGDPQVSQYAGASNFTDVVKGSWKESVVGYCVVNGITVGVGNNKFEPDRAITDAEFVTMVVRAMGYETTGTSYPYGHISAAQANGLLDDVTVVPSSAALRGEDAQIIYNALFADYARGAKQVNTTHGTTVEEYPTIAEDVFGLTRAAVGTADKDGNLKNCKAHTWVVTGKLCVKGEVDQIVAYPITDDKTDLYEKTPYLFTYEGDIDALEGYQVELWGEGVHGQDEYKSTKVDGDKYVVADDWDIKAIKTLKGQSAYDYNATMDDGKDNDKIKFDDTEVKVGKAQLNNLDEGDLNVKNANQYTLIDWDSDDTIDYVVVDETYYFMVGSVTSKKVKLNGFDGKEVVTLETDGETDVDDVTIKADLPKDLEKDDIVKVTTSCVSSKKDVVSTWTVELVEAETKELTDVDSKGKAWFDDEKIDVADDGFNFTNNSTGKWYDDLDEDDEDSDWDLYRDVNGFIIFAEEADEASKGYIFVTGIKEGANKTGDRNLMVVSGRLDDNSTLEDAKIAKDAKIYLASDLTEDIQDNNKFIAGKYASDVIGRAFKYSVNDDDQITKLIEVAMPYESAKDYGYGIVQADPEYTFTDKTDKLEVYAKDVVTAGAAASAQKVWLDDCDVIFAVKGVKLNGNNQNIFNVNNITVAASKDFDLDDVMAVKVEDLPDIGTLEKTNPQGVHFSKPDSKSRVETVVLGVDTFRYFANSSTAAGLVTYVKYSTKTEKFTVTASIPGKDDTTFTTIDTDDLSDESVKSIKELQTLLDTKKGVFCEFEFNTDGEITEMLQMNKTVDAYKNTITPANGTYTVERIVIDHVSNKGSDDTLTGMSAISSGSKIYTKITGTDTNLDYDLKDSTEYYVIGEDLKMVAGNTLNAYKDGFDKNFDIDDIDEASKSDLVSFFNNATEDDEYVVADVIVDEGDVVAVYYYEDAIEEVAGSYTGTMTVDADALVAKTAANNGVIVKTDLAIADYSVKILDAANTDVTATYFTYDGRESDSANGKCVYDVKDTIPAGTYTVVWTNDGADHKATFEVGKASAKVLSAEYDKDTVKIVLSNANVAKEVADKPELITIKKGANKIAGTVVEVGTDLTTVIVTVNIGDVTSTESVVVSVADTTNYKFGSDNTVTATYNSTLA